MTAPHKLPSFNDMFDALCEKPLNMITASNIKSLQRSALCHETNGLEIFIGGAKAFSADSTPPFISYIEKRDVRDSLHIERSDRSLRFGTSADAERVAKELHSIFFERYEAPVEMHVAEEQGDILDRAKEQLKRVSKTLLPMDLATSINVSAEEKMFVELMQVCSFIDLPDERKLHHLKRLVAMYEANVRDKK